MDANLQKYLAFVKTAECGSFTRAAEALHYSQSGISRMIGDLEGEWGVTLLRRSRTGVQLTSEGLKLLPAARRVCEEQRNLQLQVDALNGLQTGLIRVGTFSSAATHWLPNIIRAFRQDYPGVEYELLLGDYAEIEGWIASGRVDCGFLRLPTRPEFETIPLERDPLLAVVPETHPRAGDARFPLAALCEEPFLLLEKGQNREIEEVFARRGLSPRICFTTWDDYAIMAMTELGLGVSLLPRLMLRRCPYRIAAVELEEGEVRELAVALRDRDTLSPAAERFLEYLPCRCG